MMISSSIHLSANDIISFLWLNNTPFYMEENKKSIARETKNHSHSWRWNNSLLNDQWVFGGIRKEIKKFLESNRK
jgi:hypothetical protein